MKMFDKIKDFFKLNCVAIEHSSTQEEVDKLNQILHDMGAIPINVSGIPTIMHISAYKIGKEIIKVELWEYEDIRLVGRKKLIEEIKAKMTGNHESGGERWNID